MVVSQMKRARRALFLAAAATCLIAPAMMAVGPLAAAAAEPHAAQEEFPAPAGLTPGYRIGARIRAVRKES